MTLLPQGLQPPLVVEIPPDATFEEASAVAASVVEAATAVVRLEAAAPKLTMHLILDAMTAPERMIEDLQARGIDAAKFLVDELGLAEAKSEEALAALGPKVDSVLYVIDQYESYAERTGDRAKTLAAKAKAAQNEADRMRARLLEQMETFKFERLPGVEFKVERVRASNPYMTVKRAPTAADMLFTPEFVVEVPTSYVWRSDVIKQALKDGATHSFAELRYTYSVKFSERDRPDVAPKKKKGKGK